jgi:hypothetical protein
VDAQVRSPSEVFWSSGFNRLLELSAASLQLSQVDPQSSLSSSGEGFRRENRFHFLPSLKERIVLGYLWKGGCRFSLKMDMFLKRVSKPCSIETEFTFIYRRLNTLYTIQYFPVESLRVKLT